MSLCNGVGGGVSQKITLSDTTMHGGGGQWKSDRVTLHIMGGGGEGVSRKITLGDMREHPLKLNLVVGDIKSLYKTIKNYVII